MAVHEETCRFHVELLADVFADLDQASAALAARARLGFVVVLDTRQLWRQRLATSALARRFDAGLIFQLLLDGGQVHVDRLLEQRALLASERFAGLAVADALQIGQFVRQGRDFEVFLGQLCLLLVEQCPNLRQHRWIDIGAGKFVEKAHGESVANRADVYKRDSLRRPLQPPLCGRLGRQALPVHAYHQPLRFCRVVDQTTEFS